MQAAENRKKNWKNKIRTQMMQQAEARETSANEERKMLMEQPFV